MELYSEITQRYCSRIDGNAVIAKLTNGEYRCLTPHEKNCGGRSSGKNGCCTAFNGGCGK